MSQITRLIGNEVESTGKVHKQVYLATHEGEERLPFMNRSFISFSYGGKNIEDFNLIATTSGDRWTADGYASFNDLTTDYDVIDGRFFWGTHNQTIKLDFELATDGITQKELDSFLQWFRPGQYKELILAEHPNRAILARVTEVPSLSMIPFELKQTIKIGNTEDDSGTEYYTSTTEYKGTISLTLESDEPFWYAKYNFFGGFNPDTNSTNKWVDKDGNETSEILNNPDLLKIVLEDNIPAVSMIKDSMMFGGGTYVDNDQNRLISIVAAEPHEDSDSDGDSDSDEDSDSDVETPTPTPGHPVSGLIQYEGAATTPETDANNMAYWWGATVGNSTTSNGKPTLNANEKLYFYYSGTADAPLVLEFDMTPEFQIPEDGDEADPNDYKIINPRSKYNTDDGKDYSTICIINADGEKEELKLSLPNIYNSYNQVIDIFDTKDGAAWIEIQELIRDSVHSSIVRQWAKTLIDKEPSTPAKYNKATRGVYMKQEMYKLFLDYNDNEVYSATISINSKNGQAIGEFRCRNVDYVDSENNENSSEEPENFSITTKENIQDMILGKNLFIRGRDEPQEDDNGYLVIKKNKNNKNCVHYLTHDFTELLKNVKVIYKNLYL